MVDCLLVDHSPSGACLQPRNSRNLPERFEVLYGTTRKRCRAALQKRVLRLLAQVLEAASKPPQRENPPSPAGFSHLTSDAPEPGPAWSHRRAARRGIDIAVARLAQRAARPGCRAAGTAAANATNGPPLVGPCRRPCRAQLDEPGSAPAGWAQVAEPSPAAPAPPACAKASVLVCCTAAASPTVASSRILIPRAATTREKRPRAGGCSSGDRNGGPPVRDDVRYPRRLPRGFRHEVINLLRAELFTPGPEQLRSVRRPLSRGSIWGQQARPKGTRPGWIGGWRPSGGAPERLSYAVGCVFRPPAAMSSTSESMSVAIDLTQPQEQSAAILARPQLLHVSSASSRGRAHCFHQRRPLRVVVGSSARHRSFFLLGSRADV